MSKNPFEMFRGAEDYLNWDKGMRNRSIALIFPQTIGNG